MVLVNVKNFQCQTNNQQCASIISVRDFCFYWSLKIEHLALFIKTITILLPIHFDKEP